MTEARTANPQENPERRVLDGKFNSCKAFIQLLIIRTEDLRMKRFDTPEKQRALAGKLREIGREVRQVKRRVLADAYPHKDYMQMTIRELADVKRIAKEKGIAL